MAGCVLFTCKSGECDVYLSTECDVQNGEDFWDGTPQLKTGHTVNRTEDGWIYSRTPLPPGNEPNTPHTKARYLYCLTDRVLVGIVKCQSQHREVPKLWPVSKDLTARFLCQIALDSFSSYSYLQRCIHHWKCWQHLPSNTLERKGKKNGLSRLELRIQVPNRVSRVRLEIFFA